MSVELLEPRNLLASSPLIVGVAESLAPIPFELSRSFAAETPHAATGAWYQKQELLESLRLDQGSIAKPRQHETQIANDGLAAADLPGVSFEAVQPLGSLIYQGSVVSTVRLGQPDTLTLDVAAGQTITVSVEPISQILPRVTLEGPPSDPFIVSDEAADVGERAIVQTQPTTVDGTYQVSVTASARGSYRFVVTLNAAAEHEQLADRNDTPATAHDLNASFVSLADGAADRGAVLGGASNDGPIDAEDWYRFGIADGQHFTAVMTALQEAAPMIQLYDSDGSTLLAQSVESARGQQIINDFVDPSDGSAANYLLRVDQPNALYSLVVTRDADFEIGTRGPPQSLVAGRHVLGYASGGADPIDEETEPNDDGFEGASLDDFAVANDISGSFQPIGAGQHQAVITGTISEEFLEEDWDFYKFLASPGDSIVIDQQGFDSGMGTLGDPTLRLYDNAGTELAFNDDFDFLSLDSRIEFGAFAYAGDYYIVAEAFGFSSGTYTMSATLTTNNPLVGTGGADAFVFSAVADDQITIQTWTPADGVGEPHNSLDPAIALSDPQDVAVDHDNVVGNETILHDVSSTGEYTIALTPADQTGGEYVLAVTGNTQQAAEFRVVGSSIADDSSTNVAPATLSLDFSHLIRIDSLSAIDLTVNGTPANNWIVVDGDTVTFDIDGLFVNGINTIELAAGAVWDVRGTPSELLSITVTIDMTAPRVIASSLQRNDTLPAGNVVMTIGFDERLSEDALDEDDVRLVGTQSGTRRPSTFAYDSGTSTLTIGFDELADDRYILTLQSSENAFADLAGNPLDGESVLFPIPPNMSGDGVAGGNFEVTFDVDTTVRPLPLPLDAILPEGSLAYRSVLRGAIGSAVDVDSFTVDFEAGQVVSALIRTTGDLRVAVDLVDPFGSVISQVVATAGGATAILPPLRLAQPGSYRLDVFGDNGMAGGYELELLLNAVLEAEEFGGPDNGLPADAQNLDEAFHEIVAGGAESLTVSGVGDMPLRTLVPLGSIWKYLDDGSDQGTAWREPGFDDSGWSAGPAELGYGDFDEATVVDYGPDDRNKFATTYFRHAFESPLDQSAIDQLRLQLIYDDSGAVYLNGVEILRERLAPDATFADYGGSGGDDALSRANIDPSTLPPGTLVRGRNVLAVEIHQSSPGSSDISFNLDLRIVTNRNSSTDWYALSLDDGQTASIVAKGLGSDAPELTLYDADSTTLLAAGIGASNVDQVINGFVDRTSDGLPQTYFAAINGTPEEYSLVVTRGTEFEIEANGSFARAQRASTALGAISSVVNDTGTLLVTDFPGMDSSSSDCGCEPPDTHAAVGPNHVVEVVNTAIAIYGKDGSVALAPRELKTFLDESIVAGEGFDFDPVVAYDEMAERWILAVLIGESAGAVESDLLYAVSNTSDPTEGWDEQHRIDFGDVSPGLFADYPKVGWNADAHVFSLNMFDVFGFAEVNILSIEKPTVLDRDPSTFSHYITIRPNSFTMAVATMHDAAPGDPMWFVEEEGFFSDDEMRVVRMTDIVGDSPIYTDFVIPVSPYTLPPFATQPGSVFNTNDSRVLNAEYRDGRLVATHTVDSQGAATVRWYEFDVGTDTPTLVQEGDINPGTGVHTYYPSIAINRAGDIGITFMQSSDDEFISMYIAGQKTGAVAGSMSEPTLVKAGDQTYFGGRGGDYSGITVDPDRDTFWAANEISLGTDPLWSTWIGEFATSSVLDDDWYRFSAGAGDVVRIETSTPGDLEGQFDNTLDPLIELYDPAGLLIADDDNSAVDGRNALLTIVAPTAGEYGVLIAGVDESGGEYLWQVTGTTAEDSGPVVTGSIPADGSPLRTFPETYTVHFSESILVPSIEPGDLLVNDVPATAVTQVDGNTFEFAIDPLIGAPDGEYVVTIASGAVVGLSGVANGEINRTFILDRAGPKITAVAFNERELPDGGVLPAGDVTFTATFDEPLFSSRSARKGWRVPSSNDVLLSDTVTGEVRGPDSFDYLPETHTLTVSFLDIPETVYTLRLVSGDGAFEDLVGNDLDGEPIGGNAVGTPSGDGVPGGDFTVEFLTDIETAGADEFEWLEPFGSLTAVSRNHGVIGSATDVDRFEFTIAGGETLTAVLLPQNEGATLSMNGQSAPAAGQPAVVSLPAGADGGVVSLAVGGDMPSAYQLDVFRNAVSEAEVGDTSDGNEVALDGSHLMVGANDRFAAVGQASPTTVVTSVFSEDFDSGLGGFIVDNDFFGSGGGLWHLSTGRSLDGNGNHSPPNSLYYGQNETDRAGGNFDTGFFPSGGSVTSPTIQLPNTNDLVLRFNHFMDREASTQWDVAEVSVRQGFSTTTILSSSVGTLPSSTFGQWQTITADLSRFAGAAISLMFSFDTIDDIANDGEGWFIDNIQIVTMEETIPDVDEFTIDLSGFVGEPVDIVLSGHDDADMSPVTLELLDVDEATVLATASTSSFGSPITNFDLGILDFVVPANGIYTLRVKSTVDGNYGLVVTSSTIETEPNNSTSQILRPLVSGRDVVGFSDADLTIQFVHYNDRQKFIDIAPTGTALGLSDDGLSVVTTTVGNSLFPAGATTISNNGGIIASMTAFLSFENEPLPAFNLPTALLPFWDDIDSNAGNVYWEERVVDGVDTLIVQWDDRPHFSYELGNATFQLQVFRDGDVKVRFAYRDVSFGDASVDAGASATVGIQIDRSNASQFSFNQAVLTAGDVIDLLIAQGDYYALDLAAGETAIVSARTLLDDALTTPVSDLDPTLAVFSPSGQLVAENDNVDNGTDARVQITAVEAGTHFVVVGVTAGSGPYLLSIGAGASPDFNADGLLSCVDIDRLIDQIASGGQDPTFDLTGDGRIDADDVDSWLASAAVSNGLSGAYLPGDANLDGKVDASDLNVVGLNWLQNLTGWCRGDFTADGVIDSGDLNKVGLHWLQDVSGKDMGAINARVPRAPLANLVVAEIAAAPQDSHVFTTALEHKLEFSYDYTSMASATEYVLPSIVAKRYGRSELRTSSTHIKSRTHDFDSPIDQQQLVDLVLGRWYGAAGSKNPGLIS